MRFSYLLVTWALFPVGTHAKAVHKHLPASFCTPAEEILPQVEECELNDLFVEQGEKCLDKLDEEAKSVAGILPGAFSPDKVQKQEEKFTSAGIDYKATSEALSHMIAVTEVAMKDIRDYKASLAYPPDYDEPEVTGGDVFGYMMSVECFGVNATNLESLLEDFGRRLKGLRLTKVASDSKGRLSGNRRVGLDAGSASRQQKLLQVQARGSAKIPSGHHPKRESIITGIEEEKAKEERKK